MKIIIALHELYDDALIYLCRVANACQDTMKFETTELTSEEEWELEPQAITEDKEVAFEKRLYEIKCSHGYAHRDILIILYDGQLLDEEARESFFVWTSTFEEDYPGIIIISLDYLQANRKVLDRDYDEEFRAKSIFANIICSLTLIVTELECHYKTTGCLLDYCSELNDFNISLKKGFHFCKQMGCQQTLLKTDTGRTIVEIASALNKHPFRLKNKIPMMPWCFKYNLEKCSKVGRIIPEQVFIGMPFKNEFEKLYEKAIKSTLNELEYSYWKANDHPNIFDLMCKVCEGIQESEYAIINITKWSPNVCFELGLCYALGRKVIIIAQEDSFPPTDLIGMEYVSYANADHLREQLIKLVPKIFL